MQLVKFLHGSGILLTALGATLTLGGPLQSQQAGPTGYGKGSGIAPAAPSTKSSAALAQSGVPAPVVLAEGGFHNSGAHETKGKATIYRLDDGKRVLRLTDFETSNGPDLHVYLVAAPDAKDDATVKKSGFVELGTLKGNKGNQNYDVPASVDLAKYRAVAIWCARFSVNFGTAPLVPPTTSAT